MRRKVSPRPLTDAAGADAARLGQAFAETRAAFGAGGAILFGPSTPPTRCSRPPNRLHLYDAPVARATRADMDAHMALPAWRDRSAGAAAEIWTIEKFDLL